MDSQHKQWMQDRQALQQALTKPAEHARALELFLRQHAAVHAAEVSGVPAGTFEDALWQDLPPAAVRYILPKTGHSIAWLIWHITRIEDMTMNTLVADQPQVFTAQNWPAQMNVPYRDTGNSMGSGEVNQLSEAIDMDALRAYRVAVGQRTRELICQVPQGAFKNKVQAAHIQILAQQGDVTPEAGWLLGYWGGRTIGGLMLMPATRHPLVHLDEAVRVKQAYLRLK
jgi:hypothetical protein